LATAGSIEHSTRILCARIVHKSCFRSGFSVTSILLNAGLPPGGKLKHVLPQTGIRSGSCRWQTGIANAGARVSGPTSWSAPAGSIEGWHVVAHHATGPESTLDGFPGFNRRLAKRDGAFRADRGGRPTDPACPIRQPP
jgi:hypothetical protein